VKSLDRAVGAALRLEKDVGEEFLPGEEQLKEREGRK
jgi:hypothetical protein